MSRTPTIQQQGHAPFPTQHGQSQVTHLQHGQLETSAVQHHDEQTTGQQQAAQQPLFRDWASI